jgi:RNA polymerase sigma-70 factor (ECF subfamily)
MKPSESELKALFTAGLAGDRAAYRLFLTKIDVLLRPYVSRQLYRLRQAGNDLEDIVQETLLAIHSRRHTYDGETPVSAWVYGIARYKLIDALRRSKHPSELRSLDEVEVGFDDSAQVEAKVAVDRIVDKLPLSLRASVKLVKLQGFSASEAAQRLGTAESTVRVNVHRALQTLSRICGVKREA